MYEKSKYYIYSIFLRRQQDIVCEKTNKDFFGLSLKKNYQLVWPLQ